jgi:hypothetical protein
MIVVLEAVAIAVAAGLGSLIGLLFAFVLLKVLHPVKPIPGRRRAF